MTILPRRKSDPTLVFTGFVLCLAASIIAVIVGFLGALNSIANPTNLAIGIAFGVFGILSLIFTLQVRRYYDATKAFLLLIFAILYFVFWYLGALWDIPAILAGVLQLLGVILLLIGKGGV